MNSQPTVITYASLKGGVGKSTCSIFTATNLAARGYKVLFIDLDPNNSSTIYFTKRFENAQALIERHNTFHLLDEPQKILDCIIPSATKNVDIIPSHIKVLKCRNCGQYILQNNIKELNGKYDFVIIDTAPTIDNIVWVGVRASSILITPVELTDAGISTTSFYQEELYNSMPDIIENERWYLLFSKWQKESAYQTSRAEQFNQLFPNKVLDVFIPETSSARSYVQQYQPISINASYATKQRLAIQINRLCSQIAGTENEVTEAF